MNETMTQTSPAAPPKRRKKLLLPILIAAAVLVVAAVAAKVTGLFDRIADPEPLDPGQYIDVETRNYYSGVVEPQQTLDIQKDANRQISEIFVEVGDAVTVGQELFSYDVSDVNIQLQQAQLELDGIRNEIDGCNAQIKELTDQRAATTDEALRLEYTEQINSQQTALRQAQVSLQSKQIEIDNIRKSAENAVVTATMDGVVKQINPNPGYGENTAFMTILAVGSYQVKATVDEMNVASLHEGMEVTVRSRVDAQRTWEGTITKIDTENPQSNQGDGGYYGGMEGGENRATKYYFYVSLTTSDELLLGQHVFVEPMVEYIDDPVWIDEGMIDEGAVIDEGMIGGEPVDGTVDEGEDAGPENPDGEQPGEAEDGAQG